MDSANGTSSLDFLLFSRQDRCSRMYVRVRGEKLFRFSFGHFSVGQNENEKWMTLPLLVLLDRFSALVCAGGSGRMERPSLIKVSTKIVKTNASNFHESF
jgi:hypothetical protein